MYETIMVKENIVHIGAALYLAGFLFQNQVLLRTMIILGDLVYVLYYLYAPETPLWWGIFWSLLFAIVNAVTIAVILADGKHFKLRPIDLALFEQLGTLTPGDFRKLLKTGDFITAQERTTLATEGEPLSRLYFVIEGPVSIQKDGSPVFTDSKAFIGEVAFLLNCPASATVTIGPGTKYYAWQSGALRQLLKKRPALSNSLGAAFNRNMAVKVAKSAGAAAAVLAATA